MASTPLPAVLTRIDALWDGTIKNQVDATQEVFLLTHDYWWQGLLTHSTTPQDGEDAPVDIGDTTPSDQPDMPWPTAVQNMMLPMAIRVDCYGEAENGGYLAILTTNYDGEDWERWEVVGPAQYLTQPWHKVFVMPAP